MKTVTRQSITHEQKKSFLTIICMLFLLVLLPFGGFILGMQYQKTKAPQVITMLPSPVPSIAVSPTLAASPTAQIATESAKNKNF